MSMVKSIFLLAINNEFSSEFVKIENVTNIKEKLYFTLRESVSSLTTISYWVAESKQDYTNAK